MQMRWLAVGALCCASHAIAQTPADSARLGTVYGSVYDSVARRAVKRAAVQLVAKDHPDSRVFSDSSDDTGRFSVSGIPAGAYLISFQHAALDSLTVSSPVRVVNLNGGERIRFDLAVPAPRRIVAALCSTNPSDTIGALFGVLRNATTRGPADSGTVIGRWTDFIIAAGGSRFEEHSVRAKVGEDGTFALCGLTPGVDAEVIGMYGADSTGSIIVTLPVNGLMRRDLTVGGRARIGGIVADGKRPLPGARIMIAGLDYVAITDDSGRFRMEVRAGTQTLDARSVGFVPERFQLTLDADADTTLNISLTSVKRMMDTVHVVAQRLYWADRGGFQERQKQGIGHFIGEKELARLGGASDVLEAIVRVPGVYVMGVGALKKVLMRQNDGDACIPSLYVDGARSLLGPLDLDFYRPDEIGGIEVYRGGAATPVQFLSLSGCGTIVVWTRPPRTTSRRR